MSCAYRSHRYRASVTARPTSVSWQPPTGHAQHPIPLRPPVVHPHRQAVPETADDAPIPVSLVQYLWAQWHQAPPNDRESVARLVGALMRSPRWHWDVTVLPDQSLPDPQHPFVSERDGRPTIGMPIAMLRTIWKQVVADVNHYSPTTSPIMQRFVSITDPALWQEFWQEFWQEVCARRKRVRKRKKRFLQRELYGYLSPQRLPEILPEIRRLLQSNASDDQYTALTVLTRWLESSDHETRTVAAQMLHESTHVVAALVRSRAFDFDEAIRDTLDRLVPTILTATRPDDRAAWVATLWELVTDPTLSDERRQMVAAALPHMMQDPIVGALLRARLQAHLSPQRIISEPVWDPLLAPLIRTVCADEVVTMIEQALAIVRATMGTDCDPIVRRFDRILAAGWGHGYDHRILQIIDSVPSQHWPMALYEGITASVGDVVCGRIRSRFPRDQAIAIIVSCIDAREQRGDWPLAPLPAHLIPWVCEAARACPYRLHPTTIRRLWLADPVRAWNVIQTMVRSGYLIAQCTARTAMDAGWGTGHDAEVATTLRARILEHQDDSDIATAVAGLGIAPPPIMESLLTELAMKGNENVQRRLISALHRGWGQGQDDLVMRVVAIIAERDSSDVVWADSRETLLRAWNYLPPHVVVFLVDRLLTHGMHRLANEANHEERVWMGSMAKATIAALAPIWTALPPSQGIASIARHVDHLHTYAHALQDANRRDALVATWASVIAAGADRLSATDIHALLAPSGTSPRTGVSRGLRSGFIDEVRKRGRAIVTVGRVHTTRRKAMRRRRARQAEPDVGTSVHTPASSRLTITTIRSRRGRRSAPVLLSWRMRMMRARHRAALAARTVQDDPEVIHELCVSHPSLSRQCHRTPDVGVLETHDGPCPSPGPPSPAGRASPSAGGDGDRR